MPILADRPSAEAMNVEFAGDSIRVALTDGREISAPLEWFPRLRDASDAQRVPDLDEDISVNALLCLPT